MKIITLNGKDFIIESDGKNWYYRFRDVLIIMPTLKELKKHILIEINAAP